LLALGKDPNSGINLNMGFTLVVNKSGIHWFDIELDGKVVTRMPLAVEIVKAKKAGAVKRIKMAKSK